MKLETSSIANEHGDNITFGTPAYDEHIREARVFEPLDLGAVSFKALMIAADTEAAKVAQAESLTD